ncbi:hypothetical protein ACFPRL_30290 [Pseudoclavibacter helvolus]
MSHSRIRSAASLASPGVRHTRPPFCVKCAEISPSFPTRTAERMASASETVVASHMRNLANAGAVFIPCRNERDLGIGLLAPSDGPSITLEVVADAQVIRRPHVVQAHRDRRTVAVYTRIPERPVLRLHRGLSHGGTSSLRRELRLATATRAHAQARARGAQPPERRQAT